MKKKNGFTLIELLAVATPNVMKTINNSRENTFKIEAKAIFKAAKEQYIEYMNTMNTGSSTTLTFRSDYSDTVVKPGECNTSNQCKLDIDNLDKTKYYIKLNLNNNQIQYLGTSSDNSYVCKDKYRLYTSTSITNINSLSFLNSSSCS